MLNLFNKTLPAVLLSLVLHGCASYRAPDLSDTIAQQDDWLLRGKLGVITPDERLSANLHWRHLGRSGQDDLRLTNPFGGTVLSLSAQPGLANVTLDGQHYSGSSAEQLIRRLTGWQLPLSQLSAYLLGDPGNNPSTVYDADGNPLSLTLIHPQSGESWLLTYQGWQQLSGYKVPRQLELRQNGQRIKLAISFWQPEP
ncbi:lipoprotein insertase outer membrane protein LolB [Ferrimonas gelatinilytica]|uniref:Outer-membrane lipoprotein LolB n=1 Tax=Ferrimonas gelatinilytica TaxID=1255257 RepID=A0ABP9RSN4_9GAMM